MVRSYPRQPAALLLAATAAVVVAVMAVVTAAIAPVHAQQIRGVVVVQGTDVPVAGATVVLLDADLRSVARLQTDGDGTFVFDRLPPAQYTLQAGRDGVQSALSPPYTVRGDSVVHAVLEFPAPLVLLALTCGPPADPAAPGTVLVGVAHDAETGVALPGARLELSWQQSRALATTDAAGNFRFCDVPHGVPMVLSTAVWGRAGSVKLTLAPAAVNRADVALGVATVSLAAHVTGRRSIGGQTASLVATLRDAATGAPLTAAGAALRGMNVLAPANDRGQVRFAGVEAGAHTLRIEQVGYGQREVELVLEPGTELYVDVRVPPHPIALEPIGVRGQPRSEQPTPRESSTRLDVITGEQMRFAEERGALIMDVIRQRFPSLKVSHGAFSTLDNLVPEHIVCVESIRRIARLTPPAGVMGNFCDMVVVVIDGVPALGGGAVLRNMRAAEIESMQYLGPLDAAGRYGNRAGQTGALLLWTRGRGPFQSPDRIRHTPGQDSAAHPPGHDTARPLGHKPLAVRVHLT
jgi:hypothetical protein